MAAPTKRIWKKEAFALNCLPSVSPKSLSILFLRHSFWKYLGFQCRLKTNISLGILWEFSSRLGFWEINLMVKQLQDLWPFCQEKKKNIVALLRPQPVSESNKPLWIHSFYQFCSFRKPWIIQLPQPVTISNIGKSNALFFPMVLARVLLKKATEMLCGTIKSEVDSLYPFSYLLFFTIYFLEWCSNLAFKVPKTWIFCVLVSICTPIFLILPLYLCSKEGFLVQI